MKVTSRKRMLKWLTLAPLLAMTQLHAGLIGQGFLSMSQAFPGKGMVKKEAEILVKFKPGVAKATKDAKHAAEGNEVVREVARYNLQTVRISPAQPVDQAIAAYKADPNVEFVEPNFEIKVQALPNDPGFSSQWGMLNTGALGGVAGADVKATTAWDRGTGSTDVVVLVIDTGIWWTSVPDPVTGLVTTRQHQDLVGNVWVNPGEIPNNGIDDDGNGYIDDVHGYDMVNNDGDPLDDNGHGTHVAGILGAAGNNAVGIAGVNWHVKIAACKALDGNGTGSLDNAVRCLEYARVLKDRGVNVVVTNNSYGGLSTDPDLTPVRIAAMNDAIAAQTDILFVAAAGNTGAGGQDNDVVDFFPADYALPNVIAVAATDRKDALASFSHYGRHSVHVGAPGVEILSLLNGEGNNYVTAPGTSQAAPYVSGLAALIKSQNPTMDSRTIKNLILAGGDIVPALQGKTITGRRLNLDTSTACTNKPLFTSLKVAPAITVGVPNTLSAISINCGTPVGPVTATTSSGQVISLLDDGVAPDQLAGDGEFTATWTPTSGFAFIDFVSPAGTERLSAVDLQPTAVSVAPAIANLGDTVTVTLTVSNPGTSQSAAPASAANVYLSVDGVIAQADLLLGPVQIPGIPAGQTRTVTATFPIPTTLTPGTYFVGTIVDPTNVIVEALETNNTLAGNAITINASTVDLTVTASSAPATAVLGSAITVSGTVTNGGTGAAAASTLSFYLSSDNVLSANDTLVGTAAINALAANGGFQLASGSVTVPASLPAGTYFLIAVADSANVVLESNEGNNTRAVNTIVVSAPARDLTVSSVSNPSTSVNSGTLSLSATVRNTGTVAAPIGTKVRWYVSADAVIATTDVALTNTAGSAPCETAFTSTLSGGSSRTVSASCRIPADVIAGSYYIGAIVDPDNAVAENNETNNTRAGGTKITVSYSVDLTMTAVAGPATGATGQNVTFTGTVRNAGAAAAGSTVVNFYLSSDSTITTSDRLIASTTVASVAAGASVPVTATAALRTDLPAGIYYIGAIADPANLVAESNNNNNALASVNRITTSYGPDLVITSVNTTSTTPTRGTAIPVTGTVLNQGVGAIGAATDRRVIENGSTVTVGIYLSTNPNITVFDTLIGTYTFSSLAAGTSLPFTVNATIPAGMTVGNYYIGAIADRATAVRESNELNNALPGNLISVR
ncbi:CARDB domain-containing protein,subtilase family protease [Burkholderiales bacterium JOSHI_001]|nr:CARDB domain-containing protein,subtilase family protease [Burkholderiales bacterium JOSHI_001]